LPLNSEGSVQGYNVSRIAILSNNTPVVGWSGLKNTTGEEGIFVHKRVGDEWLQRGDSVNDEYYPEPNQQPSTATRGNGALTVAYQTDSGGVPHTVVKRWINENLRWSPVAYFFDASNPSLALLNNTAPVIAYDSSGNIIVQYAKLLSIDPSGYRSWDWIVLGDILNHNPEHDAQYPSISVGTDNKPIVTWQENDGTSWNIYVKRWNGTSWVQLGDALDFSLIANAQHSVIDIGTDNNPVVAWYEETSTTSRIYAKRWDGTQWVQLGGFINVAGSKKAYMPSLALDSLNNPFISWHEASTTSTNVYAKRWDAVSASWVRLGTLLDIASSANAENPSIQIGINDYPTVAWQESGNVYVKAWNGTAWTQISKAVDVNLADTAANPSLALRSDGKPIIAWDESSGTASNIYVKRY
jgi:hypothetical protein